MEFYLANKRNKMAGVSNTKTSFVFATKEDLSMLIDKVDTLNTKKQISYAVNRMTMFTSSADVSSIQQKIKLSSIVFGQKGRRLVLYEKSIHGICYCLRGQFLSVRGIKLHNDSFNNVIEFVSGL